VKKVQKPRIHRISRTWWLSNETWQRPLRNVMNRSVESWVVRTDMLFSGTSPGKRRSLRWSLLWCVAPTFSLGMFEIRLWDTRRNETCCLSICDRLHSKSSKNGMWSRSELLVVNNIVFHLYDYVENAAYCWTVG